MSVKVNGNVFEDLTFDEAVKRAKEKEYSETELVGLKADIMSGMWYATYFVEPVSMGDEGSCLDEYRLNERIEE